ncbi:MAG TPA: prephenate dehydrogenase/arogenate dehydrogenase family protein [Gammaproteobacteria bacterium]|nr:prephenate dehydrogenase/arogenate dehydrogenase family protein [Gammaproteobacteria bacterium]
MIKQLSIIGVGLIGGSLALALRQAGYCRRIIGIGRSAERLQAACKARVIDEGTTDYAAGLADADMVLVAVPLNSYVESFRQIKGKVRSDAVITDVGSAKACVIEDAARVFGKVPQNFVPGHPIAGTEKSGFEAAFAELYRKRRVVLTPTATTSSRAVDAVAAMWQAAGAQVEITDAAHHDRVLASTSHLPHILAFGLVGSLARESDVEEIFRFAAGGFRDFTRIAASDPAVWRDICLRNKEALLQALRHYREDLDALEQAIVTGDAASLMEIFTRAKTARDKFSFN